MSIIFKRPMFKKGGAVGTGIMANVERRNYADGDYVERLTKAAGLGPDQGMDPLTKFLLSYGPAVATQRPTGGTVGTLVAAAKAPTEQLITDVAEKEKALRNIRLAGEQAAIEQEGKRELLREELAARQKIAAQETAARLGELGEERAMEYAEEEYDKDMNKGRNRYAYEKIGGIREKLADTVGVSQIGGTIDVDLTDPKQAKKFADLNKSKVNKYFFDVTTGQIKKLTRSPEGVLGFEVVSMAELKPEEGVKLPEPTEPKEKKEEIKPLTPSYYMRPPKPAEKDIPGYTDITGA